MVKTKSLPNNKHFIKIIIHTYEFFNHIQYVIIFKQLCQFTFRLLQIISIFQKKGLFLFSVASFLPEKN